MSAAVNEHLGARPIDPHKLGHFGHEGRDITGRGGGGPADKRIIVGFGFWIFLLSDIVLFSAIFATYAVLADATAGGPGGADLFDLGNVGLETVCLLLSSFACGVAMIAASRRHARLTQLGLLVTGGLGLLFLVLEIHEFAGMITQGAGPERSAFLSGFFALVGCHGLHVLCGLLWLGTMMAQIRAFGFTPPIQRRLMCFSLFWHALDIIWVGLFTIVYLMGSIQ
ncbi:cytochrome o ubiquinol oxidase subunit III [Nitrospirillum sp. BR 11164]|uniref:cytochrome o ubiquinol oxidase subunit III n=1 Tax=Nitrospirillum sp. BR 11164 TaxID=3104324 RepID=UPI002AFEA879|nr:cytochrome o ubiquinol oxidase subunit III [Nitrospirillum sp. BR 11164]MEA1648487.1 cytochrome o ubiquinol oxidase subunit III [Nitrospirillum sp. BR 11164]